MTGVPAATTEAPPPPVARGLFYRVCDAAQISSAAYLKWLVPVLFSRAGHS